MGIHLLTPEEYRFLSWLEKQHEPFSLASMREQQGIGCAEDRIKSLYSFGLIDRTLGTDDGENYVDMYFITEDGRIAVESENRLYAAERKEENSKRLEFGRETLNTILAIAAVVISIIALIRS